jgi:hypothetical protein
VWARSDRSGAHFGGADSAPRTAAHRSQERENLAFGCGWRAAVPPAPCRNSESEQRYGCGGSEGRTTGRAGIAGPPVNVLARPDPSGANSGGADGALRTAAHRSQERDNLAFGCGWRAVATAAPCRNSTSCLTIQMWPRKDYGPCGNCRPACRCVGKVAHKQRTATSPSSASADRRVP